MDQVDPDRLAGSNSLAPSRAALPFTYSLSWYAQHSNLSAIEM